MLIADPGRAAEAWVTPISVLTPVTLYRARQ
jgi:hypothetical protein